jgi:septum formation protein
LNVQSRDRSIRPARVNNLRIHLASRSPRRQTLLAQLGVAFDVVLLRTAPGRAPDVVEEARDAEPPRHYVERMARTKASVGWDAVVRRGLAHDPVLGADTEVVLDDMVLGKPRDAAHAVAMLTRLAGRTHEVITGVAVRNEDDVLFAISVSRVTLAPLARTQIEHYVGSGESLDKAGGYAIQGLAAAFIERVDGSYSGVAGLPLCETAALLARVGRPVL